MEHRSCSACGFYDKIGGEITKFLGVGNECKAVSQEADSCPIKLAIALYLRQRLDAANLGEIEIQR